MGKRPRLRKPNPARTRNRPSDMARARRRSNGRAAVLAMILALPAAAGHFPDTADLKKTWKVGERKDGKPTGLYRKAQGDSFALRLEWGPGGLASARYDQPE